MDAFLRESPPTKVEHTNPITPETCELFNGLCKSCELIGNIFCVYDGPNLSDFTLMLYYHPFIKNMGVFEDLCEHNFGFRNFAGLMEVLKKNKTITCLKFGDGFINNENSERLEYLVDCLKENRTLTKLLFFRNEFRVAPLIEAFKINQTLKKLKFNVKMPNRCYSEFLSGLNEVYSLEYLSLDEIYLDKEREDAIVKFLKANKTLKTLSLCRCDIDDSAIAIAEALKVNYSLSSLHLHYNWINKDGAYAFAEMLTVNTTLRELHLSYNEIGDNGTILLARCLGKNKTLKLLDLKSNFIKNESGLELVSALNGSSLETIVLGNNDFDDVVVCHFAEILKTNNSLTQIYLEDQIGNEGLNSLAEMLKVNKVLKLLSISSRLANLDCTSLAESLKLNHTLTHFEFSCDTLDSEEKKLFNSLENNHTLTSLHLKNIEIANNEVILNKMMRHNTNLTSLTLHNHEKQDEVLRILFHDFGNNVSLTDLRTDHYESLFFILEPMLKINYALRDIKFGNDPYASTPIKKKFLQRNIELAREVKSFVVNYFCVNIENISTHHFHLFKIYQRISKVSLRNKLVKLNTNNEGVIHKLDEYICKNYFVIRGVCKLRPFNQYKLPIELFVKIIFNLGPRSLWV